MKAQIMYVQVEGNDETIATAMRTLGAMLLGDAKPAAFGATQELPPPPPPPPPPPHTVPVTRRTRTRREPARLPAAQVHAVGEKIRKNAFLLELEGSDETFTIKQLAKRLKLKPASIYSKLSAMKKFQLLWAIHGDNRFRPKGK